MAGRRASRDAITRGRWEAQLASTQVNSREQVRATRRGRPAITVERIVAAALEVVEADGYEVLTMRSVAAALDTGPASLYAHVRSKAELGDLLIGQLWTCSPGSAATSWRGLGGTRVKGRSDQMRSPGWPSSPKPEAMANASLLTGVSP